MFDVPDIHFHTKKANNIELIDLSELAKRKLHHDPCLPHRLNFYSLIYIKQGKGKHLIDFVEYPFCDDSFILVYKDQIHAYDFSNPIQGYVLLFTQDFVDQTLVQGRLNEYLPMYLDKSYDPVLNLLPPLAVSVQAILSEIHKEQQQEKPEFEIMSAFFVALTLMLKRVRSQKITQELTKEQRAKYNQFITLLSQHYRHTRDASFFADKVFTTYKTLNHICKLATGNTVKQLIDSYVILEAKRELSLDKISTQQLAFALGFDDSSNFVKYFKKQTGLTPSKFQKEYYQSNRV